MSGSGRTVVAIGAACAAAALALGSAVGSGRVGPGPTAPPEAEDCAPAAAARPTFASGDLPMPRSADDSRVVPARCVWMAAVEIPFEPRSTPAATFEGRSPYGEVTDELIDFHLAPARGGVALTTVAYLSVSPEGRTHRDAIVVDQRSAAGLARLAERVHETGARVAGQLGHAGPVANGRSNGVHALAASRMPSPLSMQMVRSASAADIGRIIDDYARSARLLADAGFACSRSTWATDTC